MLWYVKGGAAVTDNHYSSFFTATGVVFRPRSGEVTLATIRLNYRFGGPVVAKYPRRFSHQTHQPGSPLVELET